jgi:hypothetical protein
MHESQRLGKLRHIYHDLLTQNTKHCSIVHTEQQQIRTTCKHGTAVADVSKCTSRRCKADGIDARASVEICIRTPLCGLHTLRELASHTLCQEYKQCDADQLPETNS